MYDSNRDGKLDRRERLFAARSLMDEFGLADANHDDFLTEDELITPETRPQFAALFSRALARFDRNRDQALSFSEYQEYEQNDNKYDKPAYGPFTLPSMESPWDWVIRTLVALNVVLAATIAWTGWKRIDRSRGSHSRVGSSSV